MRRLFRICLGTLWLVVVAHPAAAQGILPPSFAGWTSTAASASVSPAVLDPLLGPDTPAFREYIVKSVEQRSYTQGAQAASVTLYRLRDPSSAYGAYTFLRNDALLAADLGSYASVRAQIRSQKRIVAQKRVCAVSGTWVAQAVQRDRCGLSALRVGSLLHGFHDVFAEGRCIRPEKGIENSGRYARRCRRGGPACERGWKDALGGGRMGHYNKP